MLYRLIISLILLSLTYNLSFASDYSSYIIKLNDKDKKSSVNSQLLKDLEPVFQITKNKRESIQAINNLNQYYTIEADKLTPSLKNWLSNNKIQLVPNHIFKIENDPKINDPDYNQQWALQFLEAEKVWKQATGKNILLAIVDTGIDHDHEDLAGNIYINSAEDINKNGTFEPWSSQQEINGVTGDLNGIDEDANGYIDDVSGYDFVDQTILNIGDSENHDPNPNDEQGHGTKVAGVIAAVQNNEIGISGLAFDSKILPVRGLDAIGGGESDDIAKAIVYAAIAGADIINCSFGEIYDQSIVHDAIKFANDMGCIVVASSGNNAWDKRHFPSDYDEVISVGMISENGERFFQSNYGSKIDLMAPGVGILTSSVSDNYSTVSGTSFAAPYTAATIALILENNPNLDLYSIKTILSNTATDISPWAWDIYTGSGVINPFKAVNSIYNSRLSINYPKDDYIFNKEDATLNINASITHPLFKSWQVFIAPGLNQKEVKPESESAKWIPISEEKYNQVLNENVAKLDSTDLQDTTYTIRIKVTLANTKTLEFRRFIEVFDSKSDFVVNEFKLVYPLFEANRALSVNTSLSQKCKMELLYKIKGSEKYASISDIDRQSKSHNLLLNENVNRNTDYEAIAVFINFSGDTIHHPFEFNIPALDFDELNMSQKDYSLPFSYLKNQVYDFYKDGKQTITVNDMSHFGWGDTRLYSFEEDKFVLRDSSQSLNIPSGMGDVNNDGISDILVYASGYMSVYQDNGEGLFKNRITSSEKFGQSWAKDIQDIDNDGIGEIITNNDTSYYVIKYKDGEFQRLAMAYSGFPFNYIGTFPGYAYGDFNGNGKNEIAFGSNRGSTFIYEYDDKYDMNRVFIDSTNKSVSNQYMGSIDLEGDGIKEVLIVNFGQSKILEDNEEGDFIWEIRILKYQNDSYEYIYTDYIYNLRNGFDFQNGFSAADIDNEAGEELILAPFPDLYVMKWDAENNKFDALWHYPNTMTNDFVVHDFDKNGLNEIGFSGIFNIDGNAKQATAFYELDTRQRVFTPQKFRAWAENDTLIHCKWEAVSNADIYHVYELKESGNQTIASLIDSTDKLFLNFPAKVNQEYRVLVRGVNRSYENEFSAWSDIIEIYTHPQYEIIKAEAIDESRIDVKYSGPVAYDYINTQNPYTIDGEVDDLLINSVQQISDSIVTINLSTALSKRSHMLNALPIIDVYNELTKAQTIQVNYSPEPEITELFLSKLEVIDTKNIKLYFSEDVDYSDASLIENYQIRPKGEILSISEGDAADNILMKFSQNSPIGALGNNYTITAKNIDALSGNKMTLGAGNTIGFTMTQDDIESAFVYPNPIKYNDVETIYFANLPKQAEIYILTLEGRLLNTLYENDGNGGVEWDGRDKNGKKLSSGIYLFKVIKINDDNSKTESEMKKFAIIK